MFESEGIYAGLDARPFGRDSVLPLSAQPVSAPGDAVARALRVEGPVETVSSACSSAALAIALALEALRDGESEIALAGGSDSLCRVTYGGFNALRAVDERPCRPFRTERSGLSLGEGAGVVVLERLDHALERGAKPLAELLGAGVSADAHHMTAPHPKGRGAAAAFRAALEDADLRPDDVDFVNAHGTGTDLNDVAEYRALEEIFGSRVRNVPVTSTKASVGHLLGSAAAIEAIATVECLVHQCVHPTPGEGEVDPETPIRLARDRGIADVDLEIGVSLNLGFGGSNGALLFGTWKAV
jgi:3-oxoacyl-[acyl-carrier-protein] synthase II